MPTSSSTLARRAGARGGTAYAANTVFSADIVDGEVKIADIGQGAVATSEVLNDTATGGGLAAADLRSGSVGSAEVADNSLTGTDLGVRVRGAGGERRPRPLRPRARLRGVRIPASSPCLVASACCWSAPESGRAQTKADGGNLGECGFAVGNVADVGGCEVQEKSGKTGPSGPSNFAMNSVTPVIDAGGYDIGIYCRDTSLPFGQRGRAESRAVGRRARRRLGRSRETGH